jgi:hypothetical protein
VIFYQLPIRRTGNIQKFERKPELFRIRVTWILALQARDPEENDRLSVAKICNVVVKVW